MEVETTKVSYGLGPFMRNSPENFTARPKGTCVSDQPATATQNPKKFGWLPNAHWYVHLLDGRDEREYSSWPSSQDIKPSIKTYWPSIKT